MCGHHGDLYQHSRLKFLNIKLGMAAAMKRQSINK